MSSLFKNKARSQKRLKFSIKTKLLEGHADFSHVLRLSSLLNALHLLVGSVVHANLDDDDSGVRVFTEKRGYLLNFVQNCSTGEAVSCSSFCLMCPTMESPMMKYAGGGDRGLNQRRITGRVEYCLQPAHEEEAWCRERWLWSVLFVWACWFVATNLVPGDRFPWFCEEAASPGVRLGVASLEQELDLQPAATPWGLESISVGPGGTGPTVRSVSAGGRAGGGNSCWSRRLNLFSRWIFLRCLVLQTHLLLCLSLPTTAKLQLAQHAE